eukprot:287894-Chlamydomonas_euryale.AAC.2
MLRRGKGVGGEGGRQHVHLGGGPPAPSRQPHDTAWLGEHLDAGRVQLLQQRRAHAHGHVGDKGWKSILMLVESSWRGEGTAPAHGQVGSKRWQRVAPVVPHLSASMHAAPGSHALTHCTAPVPPSPSLIQPAPHSRKARP